MKKLIVLFIGLLFVCAGSLQAQELVKASEMTIVSSDANNVTVQIKLAEQGQLVSNSITQNQVSRKSGFTPTLSSDKTLLTLNFTQQFNEKELYLLLEYSGLQLVDGTFSQLHELVN